MNDRKTIESAGLHLAAVRRLGESYTDTEYIEAVEQARVEGAGVRYGDAILGVDVDDVLHGAAEESTRLRGVTAPTIGGAVQRRADEILRRRGLRPELADQAAMLSALLEGSSS